MRIHVFLGTGGVGKTSLAAATALNAALRGEKCLVLAIDPALRLRTALGMAEGGGQQKVALDGNATGGELWAALMDVRGALDRAVKLYGKPAQARRILEHPVYHSLIASLAGMQELMAIERIDQAITEGFETIVVDTAPTRHALEFLDKPEYFVQLVSSPVVRLVGRAYSLLERTPLAMFGKAILEVYASAESLLGTTLVRQILDFYSVFHTIAEGYAERARRTTARLRDPRTTGFSIVTTPFKASRDAAFFVRELQARKFPIRSVTVNRVWPAVDMEMPPDAPARVAETLRWYQDVGRAQRNAREQLSAEYGSRIPNLIEVPELPRDVDGVAALYHLAGYLEPRQA